VVAEGFRRKQQPISPHISWVRLQRGMSPLEVGIDSLGERV